MHVLADGPNLRLDAGPVDYLLLAIYFVMVLGIGLVARRSVSSSLDFFLSGRSLPAWVTGLAFISANLGAVEIFGMTANGAQYGVPTVHYYWLGAIPAMVFLGLVMMPFYYGAKVRSVPEFMLRRFGPAAHLVNGISFALAQVLIAGINLYAARHGDQPAARLAAVDLRDRLRGRVVLAYTGARRPVRGRLQRGHAVLRDHRDADPADARRTAPRRRLAGPRRQGHRRQQATPRSNCRPGRARTSPASRNSMLSVIGLIFGLGFVLSFGYWTTNFAEVQRALSAKSMSAARRTPLIGAYPKTLIVLVIFIPGMLAAVLSPELIALKAGNTAGAHGATVQQRDRAADPRPAAQRHARRRDHRPARRVHGGHGSERQLVQHGVHVRHLADLRQEGQAGRLLPAVRQAHHDRRLRSSRSAPRSSRATSTT